VNGLFSIGYFPPISYLQKCFESEKIFIDQFEHFEKQSYRNRCCIYGPNGKQDLTIPVSHEDLFRKPIREVKILADSNWKKLHWKSILTAYRNSPYFEFYENEIEELFLFQSEFLFEFNLNIIHYLFSVLKIRKEIILSEDFEKTPSDKIDFRNSIHPKKKTIQVNEYHQVFSPQHGFINDLSIIDYLFNCGPALF